MKMLEIVKMTGNKNTPLFLEVNVPPLCMPLLVGDPKGEKLLKWVEEPSNRESVLTWGMEATPEEVIRVMLEMVKERGNQEQWEIYHRSEEDALKRLEDMGIEEGVVDGLVAHPKDPALLGTLILIGDRCFPVIHNTRRGLGFVDE